MAQDISFNVRNNNGDAVQVGAWRFEGDGSAPTVHLQAGVHADEIAGMLVLHRLMQRLQVAEDQGRLKGHVTVVPQANPLGIGQFRQGRILGRFHDATGHNFNRLFDQSTAMAHPSTNVQEWQKNWCNWQPRRKWCSICTPTTRPCRTSTFTADSGPVAANWRRR